MSNFNIRGILIGMVKYQIFVSSIYDDLKNQRDQIIKAILEIGHIIADTR